MSMFAALLGVVLPPAPPSLPPNVGLDPLSATSAPAEPLAVGSEIKYSYHWIEGFIGSGGDVQPPATASVSEALARCDALARCRGITYAGPNDTASPVKVYFKMSDGVAQSKGWSSWVKTANVTPPVAKLAVGGTSNLELLLRQDYYSVQNLSRVGEQWSFSRPLDAGSVLPMCAHLGDLTLRLRAGSSNSSTPWRFVSWNATSPVAATR